MAGLCIAAFLVGLLASVAMRVLPFVLFACAAAVLGAGFALAGSRSHVFLTTVLCLAVAQIGYVVGLLAQSVAVAGSFEERRAKLKTSLRRLILQRK